MGLNHNKILKNYDFDVCQGRDIILSYEVTPHPYPTPTLSDLVRPLLTFLWLFFNNFQQSSTIFNNLQQSLTIFNNLQQFSIIFNLHDIFGQSTTAISDNIKLDFKGNIPVHWLLLRRIKSKSVRKKVDLLHRPLITPKKSLWEVGVLGIFVTLRWLFRCFITETTKIAWYYVVDWNGDNVPITLTFQI